MNLLLATANDNGVSFSQGTLEVIALVLVIILLVLMLFGKFRHR